MITLDCMRDVARRRTARERSKQIDLQLRADGSNEASKVKILVVGKENAGKSTLMEQLQSINKKGYSQDERLQYRLVVYSKTIQSMIAIMRAMGELNIDFGHPDAENDARQFFALAGNADEGDLSGEFAAVMKRLWKDSGVQECVSRSREYQLNNSAEYFLDALDRLSDRNYIPTERDVLMSKGKGNIITKFTFKDLYFELYNFESQVWQREKILHYFDDIVAILFVADMSDYDVKGGSGMSRIEENMQLFDFICNNKWFTETPVIIFLNKNDLFEEKIKKSPLSCCFPEYTGSNTYEEAAAYIQLKFENLNKRRDVTDIHTYFTCFTDQGTSALQNLFDAATDIIIKSNLKNCGLFKTE